MVATWTKTSERNSKVLGVIRTSFRTVPITFVPTFIMYEIKAKPLWFHYIASFMWTFQKKDVEEYNFPPYFSFYHGMGLLGPQLGTDA